MRSGKNKVYITVIGSQHCSEDIAEQAYSVGQEVANSGSVLVTGGLTGVMEAASKGAKEAGGEVLAIVPQLERDDANDYADFVVTTGIGHARNLAVVSSGDVVIAVGGEWGTLSEIGLARSIGRQVVLLAGWQLKHQYLEIDGVSYQPNPAAAVAQAFKSLTED